MRKPVVYLALAAAAAAMITPAAAGPKLAKPKPLVVKDLAGDANFVNGQGGLLPADPGSFATPVQDAGSDIISFTLTRKDNGRKVTALVAKLTLAAAPASERNFRIRMSSPECSTYFIEYDSSTALGASASLRENCDPDSPTAAFNPIDAVVSGSTITWTIPINSLPGDVKLGTVLEVQGAQVSVETAVIIPGVDEVVVAKSFKVGQ